MTAWAIVDTGPLVAYCDRSDSRRAWVGDQFSRLTGPLLTCEAVMAEAFYLLQKRSDMQAALLGMITMGVLKIPFRLEEEASAIAKLRTKYNSVPMSLADACLVRMSEVYPHHRVCTFDSHFKVYRKNVRDLIPVFMPNDAK